MTPRTAARQTVLSFTISWGLFKLTSTESVMPSNHLILCHPSLFLASIFPSIRVFSNESTLASSGQGIGVSTLASVLPMNIQGWFPLGFTGLIYLQSKDLPGGSVVKNLVAMQETQVQSLGQEDPLEKRIATHSHILVWRIPWTEGPDGLQSMELQSQTWLND